MNLLSCEALNKLLQLEAPYPTSMLGHHQKQVSSAVQTGKSNVTEPVSVRLVSRF